MYYVMKCEGIVPRTTIDKSPKVPGSPWNSGQPITATIKEPLVYTLDPDYPGKMIPMYAIGQTLIRDDLLKALRSAGVDNLQTFRAVIKDPTSGKEHTDYSAVNIIGVVSAADRDKSKAMAGLDSPMIDAVFESLVIDETKTGGALMFRLAEAVNAIVVHEQVKQKIEAEKIPGMRFYEPGEWSG
jgi:hypothetical protein